jgi:protein-disulfide isomerase
MKRHLPYALVLVVLLIGAGAGTALFFWKERTAKASAVKQSSATVAQKPGAEPAHIRGATNAPVKIEEFGDFQCPSCAALSPALSQAEQKYHGKVCVIFRHFPLANHKNAEAAARAAEAAGFQRRFWEMHDFLYGSQLVWTRAVDPRELFYQFAKAIGVDLERFKLDMESEQGKLRIRADQERASSLGVTRTPAIFIDGERLPDSALNQRDLLQAIEKAVKTNH